MARIIYKKDCKGQNRLDCIEGIEIELLNGQKALIYPKYAERALLEDKKIDKWAAPKETEIEALKVEDTYNKTRQLIILGSPAALWVDQFFSDEHNSYFKLPSLLAVLEVHYQKKDIDALAETIEGADLLQYFDSDIWSCSRYNELSNWIIYSSCGLVSSDFLYNLNLSIPVVLYR